MDFSWSEMLLVGIVALIVIGPKDLPGMFRELGRITAKIRSMGREFSRAMEQAAKESGVKEAADGLKAVSNPVGTGLNAVKSAADKFEKWDPIKNAAVPTKPLTPPPMPAATPVATAAPTVAEVAPVAPVGPATAALYEQQAARKAVVDEAAAKLRSIAQPAPEAAASAEAPAKRSPGRRRTKPDSTAGDEE
ncbi:MAG TPA: twin-arginine translocase TatA/TatE family subunit [Tabrizicola sp.]|jgi:sec-independent protein translocase protein TatB